MQGGSMVGCGLGKRDGLRRPPADAAGQSMAEAHGDDADEEMRCLDHPVIGARKQAQLRDAEGRDDEAPDENEKREPSGAGCSEAHESQSPQADDEETTQLHVEWQQRERVAGPEKDPEHDESNAEEADEQARDENDGLHGGLTPGRVVAGPSTPPPRFF